MPALVAVVVLAVAGIVVRSGGSDPDPASRAGAGSEAGGEGADPGGPTPGPTWDFDHRVGETARLDDGALARVNGVDVDVTLPPGMPAPEPGTRLVRADVEVCAGEAQRFVDAALWLGMGEDRRVHSAHMGVRHLQTITLAPGSCQRGAVDLALPEDVALAAVLLIDEERTTAAAWSVGGAEGAAEPLRPDVTPRELPAGATADLEDGGAATLHEVTPDAEPAPGGPTPDAGAALLRVEAEVCAGGQALPVSPRDWLVTLEDHRLVTAERAGAGITAGDVAPGGCERGTVDFTVPGGGRAVAVVYAFGGAVEEARWRVEP